MPLISQERLQQLEAAEALARKALEDALLQAARVAELRESHDKLCTQVAELRAVIEAEERGRGSVAAPAPRSSACAHEKAEVVPSYYSDTEWCPECGAVRGTDGRFGPGSRMLDWKLPASVTRQQP